MYTYEPKEIIWEYAFKKENKGGFPLFIFTPKLGKFSGKRVTDIGVQWPDPMHKTVNNICQKSGDL